MMSLMILSRDQSSIKKYTRSLMSEDDILIEVSPEKTEYSIKDIRDIIKQTQIYFSQKRFFLLRDFHQSSLEAQNAFLKILEESPQNVTIIITTSNSSSILPTIRSRAKIINLNDNSVLLIDHEFTNIFDTFIKKPTLSILGHSYFQNVNKEKALLIINQLIYYFKNQLISNNHSSSILKEILLNQSLIETNNLNPQLTIDHILIFIYKKYKMS